MPEASESFESSIVRVIVSSSSSLVGSHAVHARQNLLCLVLVHALPAVLRTVLRFVLVVVVVLVVVGGGVGGGPAPLARFHRRLRGFDLVPVVLDPRLQPLRLSHRPRLLLRSLEVRPAGGFFLLAGCARGLRHHALEQLLADHG
jgi:hypothetical protein